ncbi:hypothetical protein [Actinomycetospora sp. CA-053990]|uniref:hypothetical protein n=1 Tax=Actinomycetospora sp. CA-053990 TaxID=3239891 RepID=UPI003D8B6761
MTSTPGEPPAVQGWVALALGLGCVVVTVLVWRGTWRSWVGGPTGSGPLFVFPAGALLAFDYAATFVLPEGRTGSRIAAPLLLAAILVIVLGLWGPSWFAPRWYRERHARGTATPAADRQPAPAQNSEALARSARRPVRPERRRQAALLEAGLGAPEGTGEPDLVPGHLLLYPDEIVFCAEAADDAVRPGPTIRAIPAGSVVAVEVTPTARTRVVQVRFPTVAIHTADGTAHRFECARARVVADDLVGLYGARRTPG